MARDKLPTGTQAWYFRDHQGQAAIGSQSQKQAILRSQSRAHECNRLSAVAETLAMVSILTQQKILSGREVVTVKGAEFQWVSGSNGVVAAHCLPGWLRFNSIMLNDSPTWTPSVLKEHGIKPLPCDRKLWNLGATIDLVDATLNKADSDLEKMSGGRGLKSAFASSTELLMTKLIYQRCNSWEKVRELVGDALNHYRMKAAFVCEERLGWYVGRRHQIRDNAALETLTSKCVIVEAYLGEIRNSGFAPSATSTSGFDLLVRDVVI